MSVARGSSRAFTLSELLIFIGLLSVSAMVALPLALRQRATENEQHAGKYLKMIAGAQAIWHQQTGAYASMHQLTTTVPVPVLDSISNISIMRAPFFATSPPFLVSNEKIGHRGGYRFQLAFSVDGNDAGCWAWPNLNNYSGSKSYYIDFESQMLFESVNKYSFKETPQGVVPASSELNRLEIE
jgi:competence protein ComGC